MYIYVLLFVSSSYPFSLHTLSVAFLSFFLNIFIQKVSDVYNVEKISAPRPDDDEPNRNEFFRGRFGFT